LQLFCSFISDPKKNKYNKEKNEKKKEEKINPVLKNEINNNHKYVSKFFI